LRGGTSTPFQRGEGAWLSGRTLYFSTTADHRVWALDLERDRLTVIYAAAAAGSGAVLREPDNVTVHPLSGDVFVAEDSDDLQLVLLAERHGRVIGAPFLQFDGHDRSEVTGPAFSPDGTRLYVNSQRGRDGLRGMTFEISGPFRRA
jgi:secreted PhoX family phosphatase